MSLCTAEELSDRSVELSQVIDKSLVKYRYHLTAEKASELDKSSREILALVGTCDELETSAAASNIKATAIFIRQLFAESLKILQTPTAGCQGSTTAQTGKAVLEYLQQNGVI